MIEALRVAVIAIGEYQLGIKANDVGTHSIRSAAAMSIYLGVCPVYAIMMIGRWSSDAFLKYIRKQVEQFSLHTTKGFEIRCFHIVYFSIKRLLLILKTINWVLESFLKIRFSPLPGPVCKKDASTINISQASASLS